MKPPFQGWRHRFGLKYNGWLLHSLARLTFWSEKFQQRFSSMGLALLVAVVITLVFGADTKSSTIYQLFSLFVALLVVSLLAVWFLSKRHNKPLEVSRSLPNFATVGVTTHYQIRLQNKSKTDFYKLSIDEFSRLPTPSLNQFLNMREPNESQRNWYDRHTGFYRFVWLQQWLCGTVFTANIINKLQAGKTCICDIPLLPLRRGYIYFSNIRLRFPEPLGLAYVFEEHPKADALLVLPKAYRLPFQLLSHGRQAYQQSGVSQTSDTGESEAFSRLREYRDGDSPRHMHWPSWASANKPLIKEFEAMCFTRSALLLDNCIDDQQSQMFEEAIAVAAGFAMQSDGHGMLLDLLFAGEDTDVEGMKTGKVLLDAEHMLETLATLQACTATHFSTLSAHMLGQTERSHSCVLILLAWDEARQNLVQQLQALSIPVRVFLIQDEHAPAILDVHLDAAHFHVLQHAHIQADLDKLA